MTTLTETIKRMDQLKEQDPALDPQNDGEYNDEGGMAITQLKTAQDAINDLMGIIQKDDNLPEWVQSKLTKAVDYMDSVRDYLGAEFKESRASRDARRDAAKDPDMKSKGFDKDNVASADDVAKAGKNIIVQLKKASDVKGNREIEFADGKKKKIKPEILDKLLKVFMQIPKPRDKEKFQQMIAKSERDMMNIAKKLGASYNAEELEAELDGIELDEAMANWKVTVVKPVNKLKKGESVSVKANNIPQAMKKAAKAFGDSNLIAVPSTHFDVVKEEVELDERFTPKEIKMAIGVASDKRYAGGNMTGAVNAIEKIKKGLSKHKQVAAVLQRQNEDLEEDYYQVVYYDEKGHTDGEKLFKDKKKADAWAERGNKINKLGGKSGYKVFKVKGKMESVTEEAEMDYDKMFEEAFEPKSLDDVVKQVVFGLQEAQSGDKEAYQKFFKAAMKKFGVSSPGELSGDKEKEFYDYIDKNWKGDNEKSESAEEGGDDHAEVGKSGKKMKVKVDPEIEEAYEYIVSEGIEMDDLTEEQLDELIGKIARGIVGGVKKVANRMSASGRADAAEKKADKLEKKKKDLERIRAAKERAKKAKENLKKEERFFKEAEMTDAQIAKREEIVKELKKKEADFKEKYGDRAKEVMYATATKMAMKS